MNAELPDGAARQAACDGEQQKGKEPRCRFRHAQAQQCAGRCQGRPQRKPGSGRHRAEQPLCDNGESQHQAEQHACVERDVAVAGEEGQIEPGQHRHGSGSSDRQGVGGAEAGGQPEQRGDGKECAGEVQEVFRKQQLFTIVLAQAGLENGVGEAKKR
jgi:hypothetical protein